MGLHSTYIKRQESLLNQHQQPPTHPKAEQCDESFISLPADYTSLGSEDTIRKPPLRHLSVSQSSLADISIVENELKKMRHLSKSQDNLNNINVIQREIRSFRENPEVYQRSVKNDLDKDIESSDDEINNQSYQDDFKSYDTISSQSCCSITTEANCDFDFYSKNDEDNDDSYIMRLPNSSSGVNTPVMRSFKPFETGKNNNEPSTTKNQSKVSKSFCFL